MATGAKGAALVTGASSGIGFELARCFAEDGHDLIITADDGPQLDAAASRLRDAGAARVEPIVADLAQPNGAAMLYDAVRRLDGLPEYLVNNAGAGVFGDFVRDTELADELAIIQLNVISVVHLTKLFARPMVARGSGRILITSSVAALVPTPKLTVYSATKAFDYTFAEALADELKDTGVTVTALLPSETETEFFKRANMEGSKLGQASKADPATIARAGYDAMMKGADHVLAPFKAKVRAALTAVAPERVLTAMARAD